MFEDWILKTFQIPAFFVGKKKNLCLYVRAAEVRTSWNWHISLRLCWFSWAGGWPCMKCWVSINIYAVLISGFLALLDGGQYFIFLFHIPFSLLKCWHLELFLCLGRELVIPNDQEWGCVPSAQHTSSLIKANKTGTLVLLLRRKYNNRKTHTC